jgi:hypothetical protein
MIDNHHVRAFIYHVFSYFQGEEAFILYVNEEELRALYNIAAKPPTVKVSKRYVSIVCCIGLYVIYTMFCVNHLPDICYSHIDVFLQFGGNGPVTGAKGPKFVTVLSAERVRLFDLCFARIKYSEEGEFVG